MKSNQKGFTLVEIAIVLVIIGLLLGGVLKGQELITQAKVRNVINDFSGVSASFYSYQDRYKKYPGDDNQAKERWPNGGAANGDGDGSIGTSSMIPTCKATGDKNENCWFWQHLRLAGFVVGDPASTAAPQNAAGGFLIVEQGALGLVGPVLCSTKLPGKIATAVDAQFDDGNPLAGQVRATSGELTTAAPTAPTGSTGNVYVDDGATVYTVCKALN